jgi:hypothetical protein
MEMQKTFESKFLKNYHSAMANFGISSDDEVEPAPPINSAYHPLDE